VRSVAHDAAEYITLGLAPLAKREQFPHSEPAWLKLALRLTGAYGKRFYNFEGLENFKAKFHPDTWEPVFAIQRSRTFSPLALYAIAGAFASGSPLAIIAEGLLRHLSARRTR
jgi:phosphatidylglycerol lysyltransferase